MFAIAMRSLVANKRTRNTVAFAAERKDLELEWRERIVGIVSSAGSGGG